MSEGEYQYQMAMCEEAGKPEMDERTWVTKDGREVKVADMSDSHLLNTVRMLQRKAARIKMAAELSFIGAESTLNGEMSQLAVQAEADRLSEMDEEDFLLETIPPYKRMLREIRIRRLEL